MWHASWGNQTEKHKVSVYFDPDFPTIIGDESRLTQVINNLVSNAIKYSPDGGKMLIKGDVHPDYVTVSVRDEGHRHSRHEHGPYFPEICQA